MDIQPPADVTDENAMAVWAIGILLAALVAAGGIIRHLYLRVVNEMKEDREQYQQMLEATNQMLGMVAERVRSSNELNVEVKDALKFCKARNGQNEL